MRGLDGGGAGTSGRGASAGGLGGAERAASAGVTALDAVPTRRRCRRCSSR